MVIIGADLAFNERSYLFSMLYGVSAKGYKSGSQRPYRWGETS
jgi:hypothetical protein